MSNVIKYKRIIHFRFHLRWLHRHTDPTFSWKIDSTNTSYFYNGFPAYSFLYTFHGSHIRKYSSDSHLSSHASHPIQVQARLSEFELALGTFYRTSNVFSAVDAGSDGDGGSDESEHVASRGPHGGRHQRASA